MTVDPISAMRPGTAASTSVVLTIVDALRVRSKPGTGDDSIKLEPLLRHGTPLLVVDGPTSASGYEWYDVVPLKGSSPSGWVAAASRGGEPWVATGAFECPQVPADLGSLTALPAGVGSVCFPRTQITVRARVVGCNCDVDGPWYSPEWFFLGSGSPLLLVDPVENGPPSDMADWFVLNLDPSGEHPDRIPDGDVVELTGMFDHPAAASCTRTEMDGEPLPSQECRLRFAVTRLVSVEP